MQYKPVNPPECNSRQKRRSHFRA